MKTAFLVVSVLLPAVLGCSMTNEEYVQYLADPKAQRVAAQICLPNRTAYFDELKVDVTDLPANHDDAVVRQMFQEAIKNRTYANPYKSTSTAREYQTILRWRAPSGKTDFPRPWIRVQDVRNFEGSTSAGSKAGFLSGSTERNQPVFFWFVDERLKDLAALSVLLEVERGGASELREFWFKLPKAIPRDAYTTWLAPLSEEGRAEAAAADRLSTFSRLIDGKEMPVRTVGPDAPRIRYMLLSREEEWARHEDGRRAITLEFLRQATQGIVHDENRGRLLPARSETIPPC